MTDDTWLEDPGGLHAPGYDLERLSEYPEFFAGAVVLGSTS